VNKFYGIGVGPGEPELITLKALKVLKEASVIFTPKASVKAESLARTIVEGLLPDDANFFELEFPMTKDETELKKRYLKSARLIADNIKNGKPVAYLTIGDPLLYSTYIYLLRALAEVAPDLTIETIPGVAAYSAIASRLGFSLAEKNQRLCICPVPTGDDAMTELREVIEGHDTIVIMKVAKKLAEVLDLIEKMGLTSFTVFGSRIGLPDEKIIDGARQGFNLSAKEGYLSTIIVRKGRLQ
jgi:precorrin-2/cobalt-factor-2 C20-methyltransferase